MFSKIFCKIDPFFIVWPSSFFTHPNQTHHGPHVYRFESMCVHHTAKIHDQGMQILLQCTLIQHATNYARLAETQSKKKRPGRTVLCSDRIRLQGLVPRKGSARAEDPMCSRYARYARVRLLCRSPIPHVPRNQPGRSVQHARHGSWRFSACHRS